MHARPSARPSATAESQFTGDKQAGRPFRMTMTFRRRRPRHDERNANSNLVRASSRSYMYQHTHVCWYADIPTFPSAVSVNDFGHPAVCVQPWHCRHTRRTMVLQCRGSTFLAARQATQASRGALRATLGRETEAQAQSRVLASNLGLSGPCCASGTCNMRRPAINTQECRAAAGGGGTCLPVGSSILVEEDTLLAGVESAVAKLTCWAAPIILPTDNGEVDIAPLLGAKGRDAASTDAYRSLLTHIYHGNEHRLYLSKNFCGCDDDSISALQEVICSRARDSRIDLKTKKRFPTYKDRNYPYILCQCKHRSSDGRVESESKDYAKEGDVYAANIAQGRKDVQARSDIQENGSRGHKSNVLNTPKCTMHFTLKYDSDKSRWYVTVGSGCSSHYGHKQRSAQEMRVKKKFIPQPEQKDCATAEGDRWLCSSGEAVAVGTDRPHPDRRSDQQHVP